MVDVADSVGEGIREVSRETAVASFMVGDLWGGRSL